MNDFILLYSYIIFCCISVAIQDELHKSLMRKMVQELEPTAQQLANVEKWLKNVTYKNSEFYLKLDGINEYKQPMIVMKTPTICVHDNESMFLYSFRNVQQFDLNNEQGFAKTMLSLIWQQETHEAMEIYKYNGVQAFDPHKPENEYNMTVNWSKNG